MLAQQARRTCCAAVAVVFSACHSRPLDTKTSHPLGDMRTLVWALTEYKKSCAGFPSTLDSLGSGGGAARSCTALGLIADADRLGPLAPDGGRDGAYEWRYDPASPIQDRTPPVYEHFGLATTWRGAGSRYSFWTSDAGTIRFARGRAARSTDAALE
jgi:hypothetical protein